MPHWGGCARLASALAMLLVLLTPAAAADLFAERIASGAPATFHGRIVGIQDYVTNLRFKPSEVGGGVVFSASFANLYMEEIRWQSLAPQEEQSPSAGATFSQDRTVWSSPAASPTLSFLDDRSVLATVEDVNNEGNLSMAPKGECSLDSNAGKAVYAGQGSLTRALAVQLKPFVRVACDVEQVEVAGRSHYMFVQGALRIDWNEPENLTPRRMAVELGHASSANRTLAGVYDHRTTMFRIVTHSPAEPLPGTEAIPRGRGLHLQGEAEAEVFSPLVPVAGELSIPAGRGNLEWGPTRVTGELNRITASGIFTVVAPTPAELSVRGYTSHPSNYKSSATAAPSLERGEVLVSLVIIAVVGGIAAGRLIAPILGFFTRLTEDRALVHPRRRMITEFVRANPGSRITDVARRLRLSRSVVRHHVLSLCGQGLLQSVRKGRERFLYLPGDEQQACPDVATAGGKIQRLKDLLRDTEDQTQDALAEQLGVTRSYVSRLIRKLRKDGVIDIARRGHRRAYRIVDR